VETGLGGDGITSMVCDLCERKIQNNRALVVWAAGKKTGLRTPAGRVMLVHRHRCADVYRRAVDEKFFLVTGNPAVACDAEPEAFRGDGEKIGNLRRIFEFAPDDLRRLRAIDQGISSARTRLSLMELAYRWIRSFGVA